MKKRLCIGIQKKTPAWETVLNQIGVCYEEINYSLDLSENYSVILLNEEPDPSQIQSLKKYLEYPGGLIELKGSFIFHKKSQTTSSFARTILRNQDHEAFQHIPFIDIYSTVRLHNKSSLFEGLIHFSSNQNGFLAFLGLDIASIVQKNNGYQRKRFNSSQGESPDEIVSKASKHELIDLLSTVLKELHIQQGLPFITKWTSPVENPVFCFRVDSDFGDKDSIDALYNVIDIHKIAATWFLHVEAHQDWLNHFHSFRSQEIALHGYHHGTSRSESKTRGNIQAGKEYLQQTEFSLDGFCAPYGIWNKALKNALTENMFIYSSEFTFAYDGYPIEPVGEQLPLQIPIHPICTGSLNRRKYSLKKMKDYFTEVSDRKLGRFEPVLFYHHPLQPGLEVVDHMFELATKHNLHNLTFSEYTDFWKSRNQFKFEAWVQNDELMIQQASDPEMLLKIETNHHSFDLVQVEKGKIELPKTPKFEYSNSYLPKPEEINELRTKDLKLLKTSILDWKNRIRL